MYILHDACRSYTVNKMHLFQVSVAKGVSNPEWTFNFPSSIVDV